MTLSAVLSGTDAPRRSTAARVLDVLSAFRPRQTLMNLTQLAQATDLPIATTYRLAKELTASGLLERNPDGTYQVGTRVWELGALAPRPKRLTSAARPHLEGLHRSTGEFVHLAVLQGSGLLVIDRVMSQRSVPNISDLARRLPFHASSVGKVHLAFGPPELTRSVLRGTLPRFTEHTVTDAESLSQQLDGIVARRLAYTYEELTVGTVSVASPVFDACGEFIAAVGVLARPGRSLSRLAPEVLAAATDIAVALGMRPHAERDTRRTRS